MSGAELPTGIAQALGAPVVASRPVAGGDVNQAARLTLADGRRVFVKHRAHAPRGMYAAEARGLAWLDTGDLAVPEVLAVDERFLALGWLETAAPDARSWEALGTGLAAVHRAGAPGFGGPPGYIATLPQEGEGDDWASFYGAHRLAPMARGLPAALRRRIDGLMAALPERVGPAESPARLHGDLWSGNVLFAAGADGRGVPGLIDPASAGGHRELDLAMMRLFGGFPERCFAAYDAAFPLAPGWRERVPLYQLYFLLVHVRLFGAGWHGRVADCLDTLRT